MGLSHVCWLPLLAVHSAAMGSQTSGVFDRAASGSSRIPAQEYGATVNSGSPETDFRNK